MINVLFALLVLGSADLQIAPPVTSASETTSVPTDRFAGRSHTRIPFTQNVRNFQVKRENSEDILYLETSRDRWFRGEISCFGIDDPRDAQALIPIDRTSGFDRFSRIALVSFGHRTTECRLDGLVALTPEEAVELKLFRPRRAAAAATTPAS
jgi:hypothetical protein